MSREAAGLEPCLINLHIGDHEFSLRLSPQIARCENTISLAFLHDVRFVVLTSFCHLDLFACSGLGLSLLLLYILVRNLLTAVQSRERKKTRLHSFSLPFYGVLLTWETSVSLSGHLDAGGGRSSSYMSQGPAVVEPCLTMAITNWFQSVC